MSAVPQTLPASAPGGGMHAVPPPQPSPQPPPSIVASEIRLVDQSTGEAHRIFLRDGALIWDNGGVLPMVAISIQGGELVVMPVEPEG